MEKGVMNGEYIIHIGKEGEASYKQTNDRLNARKESLTTHNVQENHSPFS
jgi:hypothetical protein